MKLFKLAQRTALLAAFVSIPSFALAAGLTQQDQNVLSKLNQGSISEVQLGNLAQKMASNNDVKDFGKRMADDHAKLQKQVQQLASNAGIKLPAGMSSEGQSSFNQLRGKSGPDFDKAYMQTMLKDHQKDISELQDYALTAQNAEMKDLVRKALPIFENHIRVAQNVAGKMGLSASNGLNQPEHPTG